MRGVIGSVLIPAMLGLVTAAAQLPPEIMADRYLVRVERLMAEKNHEAALEMMDKIIALQKEHNLTVPDEFHFKYAQIAMSAGSTEAALDSVNKYLATAGRSGQFYREALELLDAVEEILRQAEAIRRRVESERRRVEAIQQQRDELAQRQVETAITLPPDRLASGGLGPEMVKVASGRFRDLSFGEVTFERPFAISKYEVTRGEFEKFVKFSRYRTDAERKPKYGCQAPETNYSRKNSSLTWKRPGFDQTDNHPVTCVSARDAVAFTEWLSTETGQSFRLPSATEWQYAAQAGIKKTTEYDNICRHGNVRDSSTGEQFAETCSDGVRHTAEVGQFMPNGVGLYDMVGNVSELVSNCANVSDGIPGFPTDGLTENPINCKRYVITTGSSWYLVKSTTGSWDYINARAHRHWNEFGGSSYQRNSKTWVGFRVVRELQN